MGHGLTDPARLGKVADEFAFTRICTILLLRARDVRGQYPRLALLPLPSAMGCACSSTDRFHDGMSLPS